MSFSKSEIIFKINNNTITKNDLIDYLKIKTKIKGLNTYKRDYLIILFKLSDKTKKSLMVDIKTNKIKGRSKFNKSKALLETFKIKIKEVKFYDDLKAKLRIERVVKNYSISQYPPVDLSQYIPIIQVSDASGNIISNSFYNIFNNQYIRMFNDRIYSLLRDAYLSLNKIKSTLPNYIGAKIQMEYLVDSNGATPRYSDMIDFSDEFIKTNPDQTKLIFSPKLSQTGMRYVFIGYKISLIYGGGMNTSDIRELKAYHPTNNIEFHKMSVASTSGAGICIYETWRHVYNIKTLRYSRRDNKEYRDELQNALKNEGEDIEKAVKNGELVNSLLLLSKKYNKKVLINFFGSHLIYTTSGASLLLKNFGLKPITTYDNKIFSIVGREPIYICNGEIVDFHNKVIDDFIDKPCFLYETDKHVAPMILKAKDNGKQMLNLLVKKDKDYSLKPLNVKTFNKIAGVLGFDCETFRDNNHLSVPYNITLYGDIKGVKIEKSFYGLDCIKLFIDYVDCISTKMNNKKSKSKVVIEPIYIYGFNNSNFDNLFIYKGFNKKDPNTKFVFTGNSIKTIKYNNVSILDIRLFYNIGTLRQTSKEFKLDEEKGVYPYNFPNSNNLNYIGDVPDVKYWNSKEDYNEYIENMGDKFDMKKYTEKYCLLDSKLVYRMAKLHLANCMDDLEIGCICPIKTKDCKCNITVKKFNVSKAPTSANLALKMFSQVFQEKTLYQSPDAIIEHERDAYYGGRTECFKKEFVSTLNKPQIHYFDRNSSYPASMTQQMPSKYINHYTITEKKVNIDDITDYYLYHAKSSYKGDDKYYIPNLFQRTSKGNIISLKNKEYSYHWGCELKEAIHGGCEIYINEITMYEPDYTFKEFSEYFYNERLKVKKTNTAKSLFYKTVMNSLYGKMGQKTFNDSKLCKYDQIYLI
jgi:hypothetical protein